MADCKFILGFALVLLVAYGANAETTIAAPVTTVAATTAAPTTIAPPAITTTATPGVPAITTTAASITTTAPAGTTAQAATTTVGGTTATATTVAPTTVAPTTTTVNPALVKLPCKTTFDYDVSGKNLTAGSVDYGNLKDNFEKALLQKFQDTMGEGVVGITITGMRSGSLILDYEIEFDSDKSPDYESAFKAVISAGPPNLSMGGLEITATAVSMPDLDMTLSVTDVTLEVGLDKEFIVECKYNKTDKTEVIGIRNIKMQHKPKGKAVFENIASIYDNSQFDDSIFNPTKVNIFKALTPLKAEVSGLLSKNSQDETFLRLKWLYPKDLIVGDFKCMVKWEDADSNSGTFEKTVTIEETPAVLKTVIRKVVGIDRSLDALREDVNAVDSRALHIRNKIIKKQSTFMGTTYLLAKNLWGNTVSAQTLCQVNGAYLVEVDTEDEWNAIKTLIADETGPVLAGATNKRSMKDWEFMRGTQKPVGHFEWSSSMDENDEDKRCMAFGEVVHAEGIKMTNVACSTMMYETFMCEQPGQPLKK